jgi:hypothetical protein
VVVTGQPGIGMWLSLISVDFHTEIGRHTIFKANPASSFMSCFPVSAKVCQRLCKRRTTRFLTSQGLVPRCTLSQLAAPST